MRDAFVRVLQSMAEQDDRLFLITGDLGFGVLTSFWEHLPKQFLNVGVAEQNMTGVATGLALGGRVVFTYSIANFPTLRCLEQIRNDAAYHDANVKVVAIGGGFSYGALGMSHHATEDLAILRAIPAVTVVAPGTLWEAEQATAALATTPGTAYLRLDKSHGHEPSDSNVPGGHNVHTVPPPFKLGQARRLLEGHDVTLMTIGGILGEVQAAADALAATGVSVRIVSMHTLAPIDSGEVLAACRETGALITIEEHGLQGGLGSAVAEVCLDAGVWPMRAHRMGLSRAFASIVGSQAYLRQSYGLDAAAIVTAAQALLRTGSGDR